MTYPTRRARIQAEAAAQSAARSRRGRSLAAGAAGLATLAGATIAGVAPAAANDAAVSSSGYSQQNTWSYSGESTRSSYSSSTGTTLGSTSSGSTASTSYSGSTGGGGVSLGTSIQRASYTAPATTTGSNAAAVNYAAAKGTDPNTYYSWGGNGPYGFDCSGLMQQAFAAAGKSIPRGSGAQYAGASQYVSLDNLKVGDLVFWSNNGSASGIYHVAMYIGDGKIAHARNPSSGVSITEVDYSPWNMLGTAARY